MGAVQVLLLRGGEGLDAGSRRIPMYRMISVQVLLLSGMLLLVFKQTCAAVRTEDPKLRCQSVEKTTAADMTTRCAFKIGDPSRDPGRVDCRAQDEGFGLEGTPKPKIQRGPSLPKRKPYMWYAAVCRRVLNKRNVT